MFTPIFSPARALLTAGLVTVLTGAVLTGPASAASGVTVHPKDPVERELQQAVDDVVRAGASGVTLRVDDGRRTYRLAGGSARLEPPQRMRPEAKLRVASLTKTFVSTVTLQLVGEGRLSLDDSIERWQPGLIPGGDRITIRQLLNHTSGLFNYTNDEAFVVGLFTDPLRPLTPQDLIAVSNARPPLFEPGTAWSYSNTNYIVMGLILQRVTHRQVSTLIEQRILRPLRLRHTFFPERSPDIPGRHAHGYFPPAFTGGGYEDMTRITPTWVWAAGALVSNVDDVRSFYRALLGGRLLRPAQLAQMRDLYPADEGVDYGLGLLRAQTACGPVWGHDGVVPGYITIAFNDETGRRGITIGLPTTPDPQIGEAFNRLVQTATCRSFGQPPPSLSTTTRAVPGTPTAAWPRLDQSQLQPR